MPGRSVPDPIQFTGPPALIALGEFRRLSVGRGAAWFGDRRDRRTLPAPESAFMRRRVLPFALALAGVLWWAPTVAVPGKPSPAPSAAPHAIPRGAAGLPLLQTYVPSLEEVDNQSFGVTTDPTGVLYVATVSGVLTYDGAWWRLIPAGSSATAFEVATDATGRVAVGGQDELGYLAPDRHGTLGFISLRDRLPAAERRIGQVLKILPTAEGFAYLTPDRLLLWEHGALRKLASFPGDRPFPSGFVLGSEVFVWTRAGLFRLIAGRLEAVAGGDRLRQRVDLMLPAPDGVLVAVRDEGLFLLRRGHLQPFAPEASKWAAEKHVLSGCLLPDGRWALGSVLGGLVLLRADGVVDQAVDSSQGLTDDYVTGMVVDREGSLWLSLNSGLARVEVASPLTVIDGRLGLKGSIYSVARHAGRLWVGTASGVFTDAGDEGGARALGTAPALRLHPVPGVPPSGWGLLSLGDTLLAATAFGVYEVNGRARFVAAASEQTAYALVRSRSDPRRVWVGNDGGLLALHRDDHGWRLEGRLDGPGSVRTIVEGSGGMVWCGTDYEGAFGVEAAPAGWGKTRPRILRVIGSQRSTYLFPIGGSILGTVGGEVFRLDEATRTLRPMPELAALGGHGRADQLAEDAAGNLWLNWRPPLVALRRGATWGPRFLRLQELPARGLGAMLAEPDGVVWLTTDAGLYRYAGTPSRAPVDLPPPLLARLTVDGGTPLFGGAPRQRPAAVELPATTRRLRIDFAPLSFRAGLLYQTRLEPIDAGWGPANQQPYADLLRLPPGRYRFRVRTVGPNQEMGPETAWSFRVLSPWYATPWALALWAVGVVAAIRGYGGLRSRTLRQRAARLEARVAEQTVELKGALQDLEAANARLEELSLHDELTGIANRRRLQQALGVEWTRARRLKTPLAVILLDLDDFKLLNDLRGHAEGDLCLQVVARYLAAAVRRTGDVLARWGGEEFAVLLPNTDAAGAQQVAEQLRLGIEALRFPHPRQAESFLTASFGVAAAIPVGEQPFADLMEAADAALYRAKSEGRNRVQIAPPGKP
jgi:diguanylate cyclase (GGDEF)-like protein